MARRERKPLGMKCTDTACNDGLHCFRQSKKRGDEHVRGGACIECGADLVDFPRVHKRLKGDVEYTFTALKFECVRHHYWHLEIDQHALNYARRKGRVELGAAAERRIRNSVGPAEPAFDGRQTGKSGNPLFYAQHATATCCRKCLEYWHGVEQKRPLTEKEIEYFAGLVKMFIDDRLPFLPANGERVPPIRKKDVDESDGDF